MKKILLLLGVLSLGFSAGTVIYLKLLSVNQINIYQTYKFHKPFYDKKEICNFPHTANRKQPYPAWSSIISGIKFIPSEAIQPIYLCYLGKPVGWKVFCRTLDDL
jgi:hypothetical protein